MVHFGWKKRRKENISNTKGKTLGRSTFQVLVGKVLKMNPGETWPSMKRMFPAAKISTVQEGVLPNKVVAAARFGRGERLRMFEEKP